MTGAEATGAHGFAPRSTTLTFWALLILFWVTLASFPPTWARSYQEHGFVVAGIVVWLILRDGRRLEPSLRPFSLPVPVAVALGALSMAWMAAVVMNLRLAHQGLFVLILTIWALAAYGRSSRAAILSIGLTALLGVPFWGVTVPALQRATVIASGGVTRLLGIEAQIGPDFVAIASGTFLIEEGCAGLNYLMGGLVLGAAYGHLFGKRWQTVLRTVGLFGGVAIVGNWMRVVVLIVLGELTSMQSPYIEDHLWQGWLIFTLLMIPTFYFAGRMVARDAPAAPSPSVSRDVGEAASKLVADRPVGSSFPFPRRATLCASVGPLLLLAFVPIPKLGGPDYDVTSIGIVPSWQMAREPAEAPWRPAYVGFDDSRTWFLESAGFRVQATRLYFVDQRQGEELIQFNNRIAPDTIPSRHRVFGPVGSARRLVNETVILGQGHPRLVWHWYRVAGVDTAFDTRAKLLELPAFFLRTPASELITLTVPCDNDDCAAAATALASVLGT